MASTSRYLPENNRGLHGVQPASQGGRPASGASHPAGPRRWSTLRLTLRVHADAFLLSPAGYLEATLWRLRGFKVRSRNRLSALTGRSPAAYALWIARDEARLVSLQNPQQASYPSILPVIDCTKGSKGLEESLASLATAAGTLKPVVIGADGGLNTTSIPSANDLAGLVEGPHGWICPILPGDRLASDALAAYAHAAAAAAPGRRLLYADDDLTDDAANRSAPHFKPDWNPELFKHHDFITGASVLRADRETLSRLCGAQWVGELIADALQHDKQPTHLQRILHHRRERPEPAVLDMPADLAPTPLPLVSIIVPTRNKCDLLRTCMAGLKRTAYPSVECIVIDNGSDDPETLAYLRLIENDGATVLRMPGAFNFSALNNAAVAAAAGDLLCFLNNDVETLGPDWLSLLAHRAVQPELGAVGARLLYPDRTVQHAGVCIGLGGGAGHAHRYEREDDAGYFRRARLPQWVSAVTAACMVVDRGKFCAVGGFDEQNFPVAFNDVDLCLKLNAAGWQSFYEPRATLIHHESKSRGKDSAKGNRVRFAGELAALKRRWHTETRHDPFHHPFLSRHCEQFLIAV